MLKCKLKVLFIARSSDMQNLGKNLNLTAFQTRSPSDERDAEMGTVTVSPLMTVMVTSPVTKSCDITGDKIVTGEAFSRVKLILAHC